MPPIIVPNRNIETYLKYEIAQGTGIAAGLKFEMTEQFLDSLLRRTKVEPPPKLLKGSALRAFFIDVLSDMSNTVPALPDAVRNYLTAGGDEQDAYDLRRFQLSSRLARLARHYGNYRPEWLKVWANDKTALDGGPLAGTEQWQRDLWVRLIEHVHAQKSMGVSWVLPFELFGFLKQAGSTTAGEVYLFGFSYIWHRLRDMIVHLSQHINIHIYTLTFCSIPGRSILACCDASTGSSAFKTRDTGI
jgi:exodeoxyribonuclease V gamma subunit